MVSGKLVLLTGTKKGSEFLLDREVTIGRSQENVICIEDPKVSRKHAVVMPTEKGVLLKDLNSGNGTYIGSTRVSEYFLKSGDVIRIGTQLLRYELGEETKVDTAPPLLVDAEFTTEFEGTDLKTIQHTLLEIPRGPAKDQFSILQKRLRAVYQANQIIASEQNINELFAKIMDQIFALLPADNGAILLWHKRKKCLTPEFVISRGEEFTICSSVVNRAFDRREAILIQDALRDSKYKCSSSSSIIRNKIHSIMCVPLIYQEHCLGVIYVDSRKSSTEFTQEDLEMLVALAGPSAIAMRNAQYLEMIKQGYKDTLTAIANAVELRDHYTIGHTWRVTQFALEIAKILGWSESKLEEVYMGGVLHDVGKIAVDDSILRKSQPLTDEEFEKMKIHPLKGAELLRDIALFQPIVPYCLYHHERYDGKGYPYGLSGKNIPPEGRLIAVADTFDAMTSNRPYRKGMEPELAIEKIIESKGAQLDPEYVDALVEAYNSGKIHSIIQDFHKRDKRSLACPFCSTHIRIGEEVEINSEYVCPVCGRRILIRETNGILFGELLPQSEALYTMIPFRPFEK
ncbi:MAG: HD domain-containing protein [Candidatus Hydrogenedentes bacterium]|nr:HD domain-containing protein [Candidatus Hydrogenedentota bacterium]